MSISIDFAGFDEFAGRMRQAPDIVRDEMTRGVNRMALAGQARAQSLVGVKTGTLRRSIIATPAKFGGGTVSASYGTNVLYARMHEDGTRPHRITARGGGVLRFEVGGKVVYARYVNHPGTKGRKYMENSRRWLQVQIPREGRAITVRIISRLGG